jgi:hypothetical protein
MFPRRSERLSKKERVDYCELAQKKNKDQYNYLICKKKMRLENGNSVVTLVENELVDSINNFHICEAPFKEPIPVYRMIKEKIIPSNDIMDKDLAKQMLIKLLLEFNSTIDMYGSVVLIANIIYNCPSVIENESFLTSILNLGVHVADQFLNDATIVQSPKLREIGDAISILLSL